jgi:hypothetical protein
MAGWQGLRRNRGDRYTVKPVTVLGRVFYAPQRFGSLKENMSQASNPSNSPCGAKP